MSHTPIPWRQGETLLTAQTKRWTEEQWAENDLVERLAVFAYFTSADQGRGRQRVATCTRVEDVTFIVRAVNNHERLVVALQDMLTLFAPYAYESEKHRIEAARAALNALEQTK
jgi:hypothetical protein